MANKSFCVLPWRHLAVNPSGSAALCCQAVNVLREPGRIQSVYTDSLAEIWNGGPMREVRRRMLAGETVEACRDCALQERVTGFSARVGHNRDWLAEHGRPPDAAIEACFAEQTTVETPPDYYHLVLSNICNLACRMCHANFSSRIEHDPVHGRWVPVSGGAEAARWRGPRVTIAPRPKFGVTLEGFGALEWREGIPSRAIEAPDATVATTPDAALTGVEIALALAAPQAIAVVIDGTECWRGALPAGVSTRLIDLEPARPAGQPLAITVRPEDRTGLRLLGLTLLRTPASAGHGDLYATRFAAKRPWIEQDGLLFDEILAEPGRLRTLTLQGGEPFLVRKFPEILDFLIEHKAAPAIDLRVTSNGTIWDPAIAERLRQFRSTVLCLSVDGYGPYYEYIRYPGRWATVARTIERFRDVAGITLQLQPVLQVYNALNIVTLLDYADAAGVPVGLGLVHWPQHLSVAVLPAPVRALAAERLRAYRDRGGGQDVAEALTYLEAAPSLLTAERFADLVAFTNDLDASRGQSIHETHGKLLEALAAAGWAWTAERRFA